MQSGGPRTKAEYWLTMTDGHKLLKDYAQTLNQLRGPGHGRAQASPLEVEGLNLGSVFPEEDAVLEVFGKAHGGRGSGIECRAGRFVGGRDVQ